MYRITLRIERLPEGASLGTSPELPGLVIQAETADDVIRLAPEVARELIAVMRETGQPVELEEVDPLSSSVPLIVPA
ncbi:MAG: type II toxin-antitoxin system HicB family antitoxin [Candidatus Rokubacteria bacterium]|nr:type II toxin-antitoxin system HicB family antitoxin [Candidatus Rokubacteria bacterium]